ncbi:5'-nucleotidase [Galdieria sulphuraria]|uniref:5'-nucleotidase n=1 Tax=Galdieria sulphuraria TaxID=130081 RepID=M2W411_GALSU|nr:5'-nucleotidase [Galdieria sulphuraria]EME30486.1 5'-nucleotidase [Galdieria sulphuraria]|eukprot:XP_005707006.1 5'-nucleotidase [Galdieria sulphuraria]
MNPPCILLTNDDGVTSPGILLLAKRFTSWGCKVIVVAPDTDQSACSHRLTMSSDLRMKQLRNFGENIFSVSGSPADCVSVALDPNGLLYYKNLVPTMAISGINLGPNTSHDVLHSGTFAGARHAAFYGVPSVATSLASNDMREENILTAVEATFQLCSKLLTFLPQRPKNFQRPLSTFYRRRVEESLTEDQYFDLLLQCFQTGDLLLNLNVPSKWNGKFLSTSLGGVFYRDVLQRVSEKEENSRSTEDEIFRLVVHGGIDFVPDERLTDIEVLRKKFASITCLSTWPETHPFEIPCSVLKYALQSSKNGFPTWIEKALELQSQL